MNAAKLELFRQAILKVLNENGTRKFGLTLLHIQSFLTIEGFKVEQEEIDRQLDYLQGEPHKFVELVNKQEFSPEVRAWKITTRGMNFLAERGV